MIESNEQRISRELKETSKSLDRLYRSERYRVGDPDAQARGTRLRQLYHDLALQLTLMKEQKPEAKANRHMNDYSDYPLGDY